MCLVREILENKKHDVEYMMELATQGNADAIKALFYIIISDDEKFSLDELAEIYFTAYRFWFSLEQSASTDDFKLLMYKAYEVIVVRCEKQVDRHDLSIAERGAEKDIVVLTPWLLDVQHAPTVSVLNYCINLKALDFNPVIVNTDTFALPGSSFRGALCANSIKGTEQPGVSIRLGADGGVTVTAGNGEVSQVLYQDASFDYFQLTGWFSEKITHFFPIFQGIIEKLVPVISVGDANPFADLLAKYTRTVVCHTSVEIPVVTVYAIPAILKRLDDEDRRLLTKLGIRSKIVEAELPYHLRNADRKNLLIINNENAVFAVVGRRLGLEVGASFIELMCQIKKHVSHARFIFVGQELSQQVVDKMVEKGLSDCFEQIGFVPNTAKLYESVHFYLNPFRRGGGTSAFEALYQGVPVLTFRYGDIYHFVGQGMSFENNEDMMDFLDKCIADPEFYAQQKNRAKKMADTVSNGHEMYRKFLADVGIAA